MFRRLAQRSSTLLECAGQAGFERLQFFNLAAHNSQLLSDQVPHVDAHFMRVTLDGKQFTNLLERKPELLSLLDKLQIGHLALMIDSITSAGSSRPGQEAGLFIKPDRIDAQAGSLRNLPDV